jgi:LacI family transcriptional regulator
MAAGMKDVASLAGVAVGTVSNVLNHPDLVRPLTRARVEAAMEQLGFIPNGSARQLRAGRSRCLGLVVLDVTNPFFTEVARGVEDYAQAAGYAVILCNSDEADDKERRYLRVLEEQRVRGILITPVHGRAPELRRIRERGTPVVLLDRPGSAGQCSVAVDDRRGGEIAVSHLLGLGHRRIALVNGPVAIRQCADRRRGALRAVEQAGLDPADVLTEVTVPAMNARAGAAAADELLGGPKPTAVFCTNDMLALGLLRRLGQAGVAVPGDLAVVGYDDIEFAADAAVPLTSVRQPKYQLGRAAAELLLDEADRPDQHEHRRFVFKPELVARASSGAPASPGTASGDVVSPSRPDQALAGTGCRPVLTSLRRGPGRRPLHTMWMPRPCTWNDMNAASTPYDPVLTGRAGRMSVSAAPPRPGVRQEPAAIN